MKQNSSPHAVDREPLSDSRLGYRASIARRALQFAICVAASGCAVNSDATISPGLRGSRAWHENAPEVDVVAYYDKMTLEELCELWWLSHRSGMDPFPVGDKARLASFARRGKSLEDCSPRYRF